MNLNQALLMAAAQASNRPLWTPALMSVPPRLWLNERGVVTDAGAGACSQWNDISGNAYHVTQVTSGERPLIQAAALNGRRVIKPDGVNDNMNIPAGALGVFNNVSSAWALGVYNHETADLVDTDRTLVSFATNATASRFALAAGLAVSGGKNRPAIGGRQKDGDSFAYALASAEHSASYTMALGILDFVGRTATIYVSGDQDAQTTAAWPLSANTSATNSVRARIFAGIGVSAAGFARAPTAEIIVGAGHVPTGTEIDQIFGYAAWRWGLVGSLRSDHPYKLAPPYA